MGDAHEFGPTPLPPAVVGLLEKGDIPVKPRELGYLARVVIPHHHFKQGLGSLARIHQGFDPHLDAEAGFLLLRGRERAGKSHLLKFFRRQFPTRKGEGGRIRPVLYVRAPAQGGSYALLREILKALKVQVIGSRKVFELIDDVGRHLREQRVELLILDEFQHVVDRKTDNYSYAAADVLKNFLSMNACQFVFAGLDISLEALAVNLQFDGRKADEFEMRRYDWLSESEQAHYLDYLAELADQTVSLGMFSIRPPLDGDDLGRRINYATYGLVGLTSRLVRRAADIALRSEAATITIEHFRKAFEVLKRVGVTVNPFVGEFRVPNGYGAEELLTTGSDESEPTSLSKRKSRLPRPSFSR
ncbi:TniB family NTP-binding protein [Bosea sp. TAF32]|uniref:TniB family NTP-binding protein n=1 Tax=Bosea sp. TAF32 TaxID=3237482 RepID=UPI003F8DF15F